MWKDLIFQGMLQFSDYYCYKLHFFATTVKNKDGFALPFYHLGILTAFYY